MRTAAFTTMSFSRKDASRSLLLVAGLAVCWLTMGMVVAPASWGALQFESTSVSLSNPDGSIQHRAGAHPDLHFKFTLPLGSEMIHNITLALPPGLVGNPPNVPACPTANFQSPVHVSAADCPAESQIGWAKGKTSRPKNGQEGEGEIFSVPMYNLTHGPSVAARFGFIYLNVPVLISVGVRPGDFGITSGSVNTTQTEHVLETEVALWGVPADPQHDAERVPRGFPKVPFFFPISSGAPLLPFLRNPTSCSERPVTFAAEGDSWENQGVLDVVPMSADAQGVPFVIEGCEGLPFNPSMSVHPTSSVADTPSGLVVDIDVPQNETPTGRATSDVRKVVTTLPQGMSVSASSASGLEACTRSQIGIGSNEAPSCPDASKIGTVKIKTPALEQELEGSVYLAKQGENPFGSLLAMYLAVKGPGFYLKLPGKIDADASSGRLTATFSETPQLPFGHLRLELKSGPRAPLATPQSCGTFTTTGVLTPWSGTPDVTSTSSFAIGGCPAAKPFAPSFSAGTTAANAGAFSPLAVTVKREDGEQTLAGVKVDLPKGVLAKIASVTPCGEADANAGTCSDASKIGTVSVGAGAGSEPLYIPEPGKREDPVYLTGPYNGGPFGLSIVTHAEAGPFNLGDVVVRASIRIDPLTAQVSVVSDPLPQIREGIPLRLRTIHVSIGRPGFIFNPTNCAQQHVTGAITSDVGTSASVSSPFAASDCASLKFAPKFAASTAGSATSGRARALGARLSVKLSYPNAPAGTQANIAKVKVSLPKQLPSRLVTLQKACLAAVFDANPASCPAESVVGHAKVVTPLLSTPLTGPAYFVSHGGEAFPSLVMVLQGSGVTVQLVGKTFISKAGITSTTFDSVPDVPFSTFELELPQGKFSALAVNGSLCAKRLLMPTDYVAQNGVTLHKNTVISASGCPKAKKAKRAGKKHARKR